MIEINIIPAKLKKEKQMQVYIAFGVLIVIVIAAIMVGIIWKKQNDISKVKKEIKKIDAESASLTDKIAEVKKFNAKEDMYNKKRVVVNKLVVEQAVWPMILDRVSEILLPDMWLVDLSQTKNKKEGLLLTMTGMSPSKVVVADFLKRLEQTETIMNLEATSITEEKVDGVSFVKFIISFIYKTKVNIREVQ